MSTLFHVVPRHLRIVVRDILAVLVVAGAWNASAIAADLVDAIVVRFRDDVVAGEHETVPLGEKMALASALQSGFSDLGRTADGGFRLALVPGLSTDEARRAVNRVRELRAVLYATIAEQSASSLRRISLKSSDAAPSISHLIIKYRDPVGVAAAALALPLEFPRLQDIANIAGQAVAHERVLGGGQYLVRLSRKARRDEAENIAAAVAQDPTVEYAQPDHLDTISVVPNDSQYGSQWHYFDAVGGVNLPGAWNLTTGSSSIYVGVIDTGIRPHADLAGRYVGGYDMIYDAATGNDGNGRDADASDPGDWVAAGECYTTPSPNSAASSSWHGTHVAGTIAAASNNASGVAGANWVSKVVPVRVLGKCGGWSSDIADGILWAAGLPVAGLPANPNPARVLNLSLGGARSTPTCDPVYQAAINSALAMGTVIAIAAGNANGDAAYYSPGNCSGVITVAATQRTGARASYSNFGSSVEIAAPGGGDGNYILSTLNSGSQAPGADSYAWFQGTSMAAPHVAGIASLMLSVNPALTPAQVVARIQSTARPFPTGTGRDCSTATCGAGIVDAGAAVAAALPAVNAVRAPYDFNGDGRSDFLWRAPSTGTVVEWSLSSAVVTGSAVLGGADGSQIVGAGDFNGDGMTDLIWRDLATGVTEVRYMNGLAVSGKASLAAVGDGVVVAVADFNGDGKVDLLWRSASTGRVTMVLMNKAVAIAGSSRVIGGDLDWDVAAAADFDGDGKADILWRQSSSGATVMWTMSGLARVGAASVGGDLVWQVNVVGDLNGDGKADLIWRASSNGATVGWLMNGVVPTAAAHFGGDANWSIIGTADFNGDGKRDVVWNNMTTGRTVIWHMNGLVPTAAMYLGGDATWKPLLP